MNDAGVLEKVVVYAPLLVSECAFLGEELPEL